MITRNIIQFWHRSKPLYALILLLVGLMLAAPESPTLADNEESLSDLWIDLSVRRSLVDLFNRAALPEDIARVEHISQIDLLDDVTVGRKLVVFKSAADVERLVPHIYKQIDIIGYNLEHGPANPIDEQQDPVASIQRVRRLADEYGLALALGPDRQFALSHGAALAPYTDILILQVQKVQTEPQTVYDFVLSLVEEVRAANPNIEISVQIRTEGDVQELLDMLEPLEEELDGISILTSEETVPVAETLIQALRDLRPLPRPTPGVGVDDNVVVDQPSAVIATAVPDSTIGEGSAADANLASIPTMNHESGSKWLLIFVVSTVVLAVAIGFVSRKLEAS